MWGETRHKRAVGLSHNQGSGQHAFGALAMFEVRSVLDHASLRSDRNMSGPEVTPLRCGRGTILATVLGGQYLVKSEAA